MLPEIGQPQVESTLAYAKLGRYERRCAGEVSVALTSGRPIRDTSCFCLVDFHASLICLRVDRSHQAQQLLVEGNQVDLFLIISWRNIQSPFGNLDPRSRSITVEQNFGLDSMKFFSQTGGPEVKISTCSVGDAHLELASDSHSGEQARFCLGRVTR